ncbi:MAG: hypothetical protein ACE5KQ_02690 [Thermoplasmata archaeon]
MKRVLFRPSLERGKDLNSFLLAVVVCEKLPKLVPDFSRETTHSRFQLSTMLPAVDNCDVVMLADFDEDSGLPELQAAPGSLLYR